MSSTIKTHLAQEAGLNGAVGGTFPLKAISPADNSGDSITHALVDSSSAIVDPASRQDMATLLTATKSLLAVATPVFYDVVAPGAGYAMGERLVELVFYDPNAGTTTAIWLNASQVTLLSAAPATANIQRAVTGVQISGQSAGLALDTSVQKVAGAMGNAGAPAYDGTDGTATLVALMRLMAGNVLAPKAGPLPTGASTDASVQAVVSAVNALKAVAQAQIDIASNVFIDSAGNYYFVVLKSDATGAVTQVIRDMNNNVVATAPAGFKPYSAAVSAGTTNTRIGEDAIFIANAPGTGYVAGNVLAALVIVDESTNPVTMVSGGWLNMSLQTVLTQAPTAGTYDSIQNAIPAAVQAAMTATATYQTNVMASLGNITTDVVAATADQGSFSLRALFMRALQGITSLITGTRVFAPIPTQTVSLLATTAAPTGLVKMPTQAAGTCDSYRVRLPAGALGPVHWIMTTDNTKRPTIPVPYDSTGANGTLGDKGIDPGGVEIIRLSDAQQAALAGAGLYFGVIAKNADATTILSVSLGQGGN